MSWFKKEQFGEGIPSEARPPQDENNSDRSSVDPESRKLLDLVGQEKLDVRRRIFDLESTKRVLTSLAMGKDSGLNPDSKLVEVLAYVEEKLDEAQKLKDVL